MKKQKLTSIWQVLDRFNTIKELETGTNYSFEVGILLRDVGLSLDDPITSITEEVVGKWVKVMKERGLKPASIKHYIICLNVFLHWCDKEDIIHTSVKLPKIQIEQMKFYSQSELDCLLKCAKNDYAEHRTYCIISFILATGARASTIINIKLDDIDWQTKEVYYRHLKNKKTAIIPLPDSLITILKEFLNKWDVKEYLFPDRCNNQLTVSALRQSVNRYCKKCGVEPKSVHALRRSFAREYIKAGGDAFTLQKFLTHSTMEMSRRYVSLFSDDLRVACNSYIPLNKLVSKGTRIIQRRF